VRFGRNETEKTEKTEKLLIHKALRFPFFIPFSVPFSVFPFVGVIGGGFRAVRVLCGCYKDKPSKGLVYPRRLG